MFLIVLIDNNYTLCPFCFHQFSSEVARERHINARHQSEYYHKCKIIVLDYYAHLNSEEHRNQRGIFTGNNALVFYLF